MPVVGVWLGAIYTLDFAVYIIVEPLVKRSCAFFFFVWSISGWPDLDIF